MSLALGIVPFCFAIVILFTKTKAREIVTILGVVALCALTVFSIINGNTQSQISEIAKFVITACDFALLVYFFIIGVKNKNILIWLFAILQFLFLAYAQNLAVKSNSSDFIQDNLSDFMFCLISFIGGLIVIFALKYIDEDTDNEQKKSKFIAILMAFLGVMNFLVQTNNLELFFTLFELTTLSSFLLVRFRQDTQSIENSNRILWMNQIGGLAILIAIIAAHMQLHVGSWSELLTKENTRLTLLPFAFLAIAALIKGAQPPFQNWLLGAMVAPTPVSAILHSSTMVKIAPFMILKLSPAIAGTIAGFGVGLVGAISFLAMSIIALRENIIKRVLAYSTIALLGLMVMLASLGTQIAMMACVVLMLFHALSKALLFLEAGVLEKKYHAKTFNLLEGFLYKAPKTSIFLIIGFLSMSVPPFGIFIGKLLMLESSGANILWSVPVALGSAILAMLYFKVAGPLCVYSESQKESLSRFYFYPTLILVICLILCTIFYAPLIVYLLGQIININSKLYTDGLSLVISTYGRLDFWVVALTIGIMVAVVLLVRKFASFSTVSPYNCGEKTPAQLSMFELSQVAQFEKFIILASILLFLMIAVFGALGI